MPDPETQDPKITEINSRLVAFQTRLDDFKSYFAGATTLFTVGFAILTLVLGFNINSERESLRQFQRDMREDLGKSAPLPQVEVQGTNGKPLQGQSIIPSLLREDGKLKFQFDYVLKNSGLGSTGPITTKIYTTKPIELDDKSTDEPQFDYEGVIPAEASSFSSLPGQLSVGWDAYFILPGPQPPPPGNYPVLIKEYDGQGKVAQAAITLVIPNSE